jgi:hypothetical protein
MVNVIGLDLLYDRADRIPLTDVNLVVVHAGLRLGLATRCEYSNVRGVGFEELDQMGTDKSSSARYENARH